MVLCIGGSDSAGLAGLQMDSRCCEALGAHAATAVTAVTAQNNAGLYALNPVPVDQLAAQIDAAMTLQPRVIKLGMLANQDQIELLAKTLANSEQPIVLDPVLATSSGADIMDANAIDALLHRLLPQVSVVTPNAPEAETLLRFAGDPRDQARALCDAGAEWTVVTGGHREGAWVEDTCAGPNHLFSLAQPRIDTPHLRGTGCAYSSLIAAALALGHDPRDALIIARMALQASILQAGPVGHDRGCPRPVAYPEQHWPRYCGPLATSLPTDGFPPCTGGEHPETLGLYPIVDRADWLTRLLPQGITTVQLRIKDLAGDDLRQELTAANAIARAHNARLFINDHWQLAIEIGAYGVHLGQEDLATADLAALQRAGLRLGISNHCHYELVRALALRPSYLAVGPVFATTTKAMPWTPHDLSGLRHWQHSLTNYPLVAIAGMTSGNIASVAATGVSGIALITAITQAVDPEAATRELLQILREAHKDGVH